MSEMKGRPAGENPVWLDDKVQFARLLCEIVATHEHLEIEALQESMDLGPYEVAELFERADRAWEAAKASVGAAEQVVITTRPTRKR